MEKKVMTRETRDKEVWDVYGEELLGSFKTQAEAAEFLGVAQTQMTDIIRKGGLLFDKYQVILEGDEPKDLSKESVFSLFSLEGDLLLEGVDAYFFVEKILGIDKDSPTFMDKVKSVISKANSTSGLKNKVFTNVKDLPDLYILRPNQDNMVKNIGYKVVGLDLENTPVLFFKNNSDAARHFGVSRQRISIVIKESRSIGEGITLVPYKEEYSVDLYKFKKENNL